MYAIYLNYSVLPPSCKWGGCYRGVKQTGGVVGGVVSVESNPQTPHCSRRTTVVIITVHVATSRTLQDLYYWWNIFFSQSTVNVDIACHKSNRFCKDIRTHLRHIMRRLLQLCFVFRAVLHNRTHMQYGFCLTGPISLCVDLFVFVCICFFVPYCIVVVTLWARWGGPDGLKPNPLDLSSFSGLTLLVGSFDP